MKRGIFLVIMFFIAIATHRQVIAQNSMTGSEAIYEMGQLGVIRGQDYENTEWKKLRNAFLSAIDRDALRAVWPYRGYDVEEVRSRWCTGDASQSRYEPVGRTFAIVRRGATLTDTEIRRYGGIEFSFPYSTRPEPLVRDLCQLIGTQDGISSGEVRTALRYIDSLTPPPDGNWVFDREASHSFSNSLRPLMQAIVHTGKEGVEELLQSEFHTVWSTSDREKALKWSVIDGDSWTAEELTPMAVWKYVSEDGRPMWNYYLTSTANMPIQNDDEIWHSSSTGFVWSSAPEISTAHDQVFILWYDADHSFSLGHGWFVMTDVGLPEIPPQIRIDKNLVREFVSMLPDDMVMRRTFNIH